MVKSIVRDILFLNQKSDEATSEDHQVVTDLLDTLKENESSCVGMAANMIGVKKRIIVVNTGLINIPMINPVIIKKSGPYETEEGCLSLSGTRPTTRYQNIEVLYFDAEWKKHSRNIPVGRHRSYSMNVII